METRRGICTNLEESKYTYIRGGLVFYFSSITYRDKFIENVDKYVIEQEIKLQKKYGVQNAFTLYFMISLYKLIEKRGFKIFDSVNKKDIRETTILIANFM